MLVTGELKRAEFTKGNYTKLEIWVNKDIVEDLKKQKAKLIELRIDDGRMITSEQRKKAYATINDISMYTGHHPEFLKEYFKFFVMSELNIRHFSLSNCSMEVAREYISFILTFAIEWQIPLSDLGINRADDIDSYIYSCLENRVCVISGSANADIHHVLGSRVGMGRNRKTIDHSNLEIIPLSREWHTRVHAEGESEIFEKFKLHGLKVNRDTLDRLGLSYEKIQENELQEVTSG